MADSTRFGRVQWIDHFVVPTNDLMAWEAFMEHGLGASVRYRSALTTRELQRNGQIRTFMDIGHHEVGGFLQRRAFLPEPTGPGSTQPRWGFFIRPDEIDHHRRRLDEHHIVHADPVRTSDLGDEGVSLLMEDPGGNQFELWAPDRLPEGAMVGVNAAGVGRISHVVHEARELQRTADFSSNLLALEVVENADVPTDTLVLRLGGGGRLVFKQVDDVSERTGAYRWTGMHTALTVRAEEYDAAYERLWASIPEAPYQGGARSASERSTTERPPAERAVRERRDEGPHTVLNGHQAVTAQPGDRGHNFVDWDFNAYHLTRGHFAPGDTSRYTLRPEERMD
jgi:hypothetical protein